MGKFFKYFATHSEYEDYAQGGGMVLPNVSYCEDAEDVHYNPYDFASEYFTLLSLEDNNTFYIKASNTSITKTISASTDNGETWSAVTSSKDGSGTTIATVNAGDKILLKGENATYATSNSVYNKFCSDKAFNVMGNIMSLISGDDFATATALTTDNNYAFCSLFRDSLTVTNAGKLVLPATTLADRCYYSMFQGCTSLVKAPELPATTLANYCYLYMFYGCTSLIKAPELPATTLANNCYSRMFWNCTSLVKAPELPVATLAESCYFSMFQGCTSLVKAPELPATALAGSCYQSMFQGCTSLVKAPELPATTMANYCYSYMFYDCTSLAKAPDLPATTMANYCYCNMFWNCTSLVKAPELPATTLAEYCYYSMFNGCTSLVSAPELPATTLATCCYEGMFADCPSLNYIKAMFTTTPGTSYTRDWVNGVAATGTFVKNSAATWTTTGVHGIPTGWTVETATP